MAHLHADAERFDFHDVNLTTAGPAEARSEGGRVRRHAAFPIQAGQTRRYPQLAFGRNLCLILAMPETRQALLGDLLKATSRSFYLTLRVLPAAVRPQIGLAYLLARTTDTIADTEIVPVAQRLNALQKLRDRMLGQNSTPLNFGELARQQGSPAEKMLLEKIEAGLALLATLSPPDLKLVRDVLTTITSGQELDLRRFVPAPPPEMIALETAAALDDYTYRVAGCVGEFWTKICRAHLFPNAKLDERQLITDGIRFGKGLQLVNILRDLPADLKNGRCYLPLQRLDEAKLLPEVLLSPAPKRGSCRCSANISRKRRRTWRRAGVTRTRCRSRSSACGSRARGRF